MYKPVARARPEDATLSARRVEHFARAAEWDNAEAALRDHIGRFPDDWWAPCLLARLLAYRGDAEGHRAVCRAALERFADGASDPYVRINLVRSALLLPGGLEDEPAIGLLLKESDADPVAQYWRQVTAALAELRRGDPAAALGRLDDRVKPYPDHPNTRVLTDAIRALAYQASGLVDEASEALGSARGGIARHGPRPDRDWLYDWDWHNWLQIEVLVREAERLVPVAPTPVTPAGTPIADQATRRTRVARAERAATAYALALIRSDIGPPEAAEAELRVVIAEQQELVAEDPASPDGRSALYTSRQALGQLLARAGRGDEAARVWSDLVPEQERLIADDPGEPRHRVDLAATQRALADLDWNVGRRAGAVRSLRAAIDQLAVSLEAAPKDPRLNKALATAETRLGEWYLAYGLWSEAAEWLERSVRRPGAGDDPWHWSHAGQALRTAGQSARLSALIEDALSRFERRHRLPT